MFLDENSMTWRSKKQIVDVKSSAEFEFHAMAHGVCELLWLRIILNDFSDIWKAYNFIMWS